MVATFVRTIEQEQFFPLCQLQPSTSAESSYIHKVSCHNEEEAERRRGRDREEGGS